LIQVDVRCIAFSSTKFWWFLIVPHISGLPPVKSNFMAL
jgi:hypothetical protein